MTDDIGPDIGPEIDAIPEAANPQRRLTRRRFLTGAGIVGTAAVAAGYGISVWGPDRSSEVTPATLVPATGRASAPGLAAGAEARTLVVIEMAGGNDGLSLVPPHGDARYHEVRPTLRIEDPIELDGEVGLHPALTYLGARWRSGDLAIVEGVGYPDPDLSHFASLATWWTANAADAGAGGWLGRYLDATVGYDDPLAGITIGRVPSPALAGNASFATAISGATGLTPGVALDPEASAALLDRWARMAPTTIADSEPIARVAEAIRATVTTAERLDSMIGDPRDIPGSDRRQSLTSSMAIAARLVASDMPPRVVWVQWQGDFDTHQGQANRYPPLMAELDAAVAAFFDHLDTTGTSDRAVCMTTSEFGRRVAENGTGTDHGTASTHLVVGAPVSGGRYGERPSLRSLDRAGNLVHTVGIDSYFGTVLEGWLGVEAAAVVGGDPELLAFI